jgi:hypothetical protein
LEHSVLESAGFKNQHDRGSASRSRRRLFSDAALLQVYAGCGRDAGRNAYFWRYASLFMRCFLCLYYKCTMLQYGY